MSAQLLEEIRRFLPELESTQQDFTDLFGKKRIALTAARSEELLRIADSETGLAKNLHAHLVHRQKILNCAKQTGLPSDSLESLVIHLAGDDFAEFEVQIDRIRESSKRLQRESWIQWIISQRTFNLYTELRDLIAHSGEKAPTYSRDREDEMKLSDGGAFLDTSI